MASIPKIESSAPGNVAPAEIYYGGATTKDAKVPVKLRIATGGAGQSGLVRALADAFIDDHVRETGCEPFAVSWIKSDTTASFNHLADNSADLSITYIGVAEQIAIEQGIATHRVYAWRDHFMLVGMSVCLVVRGGVFVLNLFSSRHDFICRSEIQPGKTHSIVGYHHPRPLLSTLHRGRQLR